VIRRSILGLVLAVSVALGCSSSAQTSAAAQSAQDQQVAANVVNSFNAAWTLAAQLCEAPGVTVKCGPPLAAAYTYIIAASTATDAWGSANQGGYACAVQGAASSLLQVLSLLNVSVPPAVIQTALTLANLAVGPCVVDGGAS
jgi:hypothetical protein